MTGDASEQALLRQANLIEANLRWADLSGTNLSEAFLCKRGGPQCDEEPDR
jgi:uncharacterized protein YjbI with pentapeptide repeats